MSKRTFVSLAFCLAGIFALYGQEENQNNYGVDEANTKFSLQSGVLGGETNYTYLSLKDHEDVSGVPLGGIGVGNINFAPSGKFTRIGMNNIHTPIKRSEHSFFSLWTRKGNEKEAPDAIIDGILAEADMKTMEIWKQNQSPISHTIVSYHPAVKISKNDVLLFGDDPCHDHKFIVKGTKDPAGTGQFSIYYVLERSDTDGRRS